ncbi:hypothetical protein C2845_PM09G07180 [Panicum miliaceum]|uniref:Uncharacterized protein n=1 Tax=Panicum miliaceum TaxID=4540 RepID=A0A3L6S2S3_PANMI|nr:hypothetical protein C2845_PM09G07180 [Panicum miliaceum]
MNREGECDRSPDRQDTVPESKRGSSSNTNWDRAAGDGDKEVSQEGRSRWDHREEMRETRPEPAAKEKHKDGQPDEQATQKSSELNESQNHSSRVGCSFCGLKNHVFEDCKRRSACELCGYNNHGSYDCRREPRWNLGPELCAAQVPDQSFFFIDEHIDHKAAKEKASVALITVINGELTARQIEMEFQNVLSNEHWRWSAKKIADNKFAMRFPSAKMILDYSTFRMGMKNCETQMIIEPWTSSIGSKGKLQQAWFKVKGIPADQRSIRTIARVGGLVGKTMEIDESTRYKAEYVRIKIACRNIYEVPDSAEGTLGVHLYDFFFELEEPENMKRGAQKSSVGVPGVDTQPSPKKMRKDGTHPSSSSNKNMETPAAKNHAMGSGGRHSANISALFPEKVAFSAPGKINLDKANDVKKMGVGCDDIPESQEDSETIPAATYQPSPGGEDESDSSADFEGEINKVLGGEQSRRGVWAVNHDQILVDKSGVYIPDLLNNVVMDGSDKQSNEEGLDFAKMMNPCEMMQKMREERRWIERVQDQTVKGDKAGLMDMKTSASKKRPLSGLYGETTQEKILEGVQVLLACAHRVMATHPAPPPTARLLLPPSDGEREDGEDN